MACRRRCTRGRGSGLNDLALATIGALLIAYATVSRRLERLNVSGAIFFTTAGPARGAVLGLPALQVRSERVPRTTGLPPPAPG